MSNNETAKLREQDRLTLKSIGCQRNFVDGNREYYTLPECKEEDFFKLRHSLNFATRYAAPNRKGGLQLDFDSVNIEDD